MSVHTEFDRFREHRAELRDMRTHHDDRDATLRSGAVLAVGLLTGGGFPGAAACVAFLLECRFVDDKWPWSDGPA